MMNNVEVAVPRALVLVEDPLDLAGREQQRQPSEVPERHLSVSFARIDGGGAIQRNKVV